MMSLRVIAAGLLASSAIWAQATAQIHGSVQDSSGAAAPGAEVKATQTSTGVARTAVSAADGGYILPNLPIGPYQIEVSKEGFSKYVQAGIVLQVNSDPAVDVALKVGAVSEQVVVEANAALVETRSSGVGEVVQTERIVDLPLNGRNVTDLINLAGNAVTLGTTQNRWFNNIPDIAIGGQLFYGTDYSLDGANNIMFISGTTMPLAFPDAVQEFKVESTGQNATHGAGNSVSVVTRSGANELHGDLFEFIRNDGFGSAREYFSTTSSTLKRNQFGGVLGGAVKKNKLFYFGGFQGTTLRQDAGDTITHVPTAAMLAGDWTAFASPACNQGVQKTLKGPFVNNTINPALYAAPSVYIVDHILPTIGITPNQCGQITYGSPADENDYQYVGRGDFQWSDKQTLFIRTLVTHEFNPNAFSLNHDLLNVGNTGDHELAQSYAIGDTYLISPSVVQSFRVAMNRTSTTLLGNYAFDYCDAGVNIWCGANPGQAGSLSISGGFGYGNTLDGGDYWTGTSYSLNDDINWIKGAHQMAFGVGAGQGRFNELNHFASSFQGTFNGTFTGLGMADFFVGDLASFYQGLANTDYIKQDFVNLYFTDAWRVTPRLTANLGIRWEPYLPQSFPAGGVYNFDLARYEQGITSTQYVNAPPGLYFPGDPGFPGTSGINSQWPHFDPRVGLAWDPFGDGKTSVRASYGFGYNYAPGVEREDASASNPWGGRATFTPPAGAWANPYASIPGGDPYPYVPNKSAPFTPGGLYFTMPYNLQTPNTSTWNFSVQRQFGGSWLVSATYAGSKIDHLWINYPVNPAVYNPAASCTLSGVTYTPCSSTSSTQARRVLSLLNPAEGVYYGQVAAWDSGGTQKYNGLLLSVQRRLSHGVSANANWTYSHCIGQLLGFNTKANETVSVPNDPLFDRGNCDSDRRHIVNLTLVAQTPQLSNHLAHMVVTGWQLAGIYKFTSGAWWEIQDGTDQELTGLSYERPNQVLQDVYTGVTAGGKQYLNPAAFQAQPLGTIGNLGWNSVEGPAFWEIDLALSRDFRIREKQALQLRADAFNLTNSFVPGSGGTAQNTGTASSAGSAVSLNSSTFGQLLTANPMRKIQFALKYTF